MIYGCAATHSVLHDGTPLDLEHSLRLKRHSPTGFAWGYAGSGPAQLALALLLEFTTETEALARYQAFKADLVAPLPMGHDFTWPDSLVETWLADRTA
jgi:hypothetical protein